MATPKKQTTSASAAALGLSASALAKPKPTPKPVAKPKPKPVAKTFDAPKVTSVAVGGSTVVFPGDFGDGGVPGGTAILTPEQYPTKVIVDRYGSNVETYTSGPLAGRSKTTGELVIQASENVSAKARVGDTGSLGTGNGTPVSGAISFSAAQDKILSDTLASYGMQGMGAVIAKIRAENPEISSEDLTFLLKNDTRYNSEYLRRFAGNAKLKAAGLPTLDDATYLKTENEFKKIFTAYGTTSLANTDYYATLIGNRMDAVDVTDRLNLGYARYKASPDVMNAFKTFYSAATDGDVLAVMMDPGTQLPILQQKLAAAEIGGAALAQKLSTSLTTATELVGMGVTTAQAQAGYSTIAQALPTYENIYERFARKDITKGDAQAKLEASRLKKNAEAIREEQMAVGQELNLFAGSSGRFASKDRAQGLI